MLKYDLNLDVEMKTPEGGTETSKVTGELKDGEWTYKMADDSPMPLDVEAHVKAPTVKSMSLQILNGETVPGTTQSETIKTGTEILPGAMENKPPVDLLSPYPKMRDQLPAIQAKVGNMKYYKFENYLRELPENVKIKLNEESGLVEPLSKKFLTDPVWANEVKAGNVAKLDELTKVVPFERTLPISEPDPLAQPKGPKTEILDQAKPDNRRSLERENESAEILAKNGYDVEQNPTVEGTTRNPDYRINGQIFDNFAPRKETSAKSIYSTIQDKVVVKKQTKRIVLNLNDSEVEINAIKAELNENPILGLEEVIAIKGNKIMHIYP